MRFASWCFAGVVLAVSLFALNLVVWSDRAARVVYFPPEPRVVRPNVLTQVQVAAVPIGDNNIPAGKATYNGDARNPVWKIEGKWESTTEDARRSAYLQAREELVGYLRSQEPPIRWVPPLSFVSERTSGRRHLIVKSEEETRDFPVAGTMRRYTLEVTLPTEARREIWRHECELTAHHRMLLLAKVLAGLVSVLAATAGYLRLDDLTKGYSTGWLRLAVAGLLGAAGLALALLV